MKGYILTGLLLLSNMIAAQTVVNKYRPGITEEGAIYFLPKTAIRINIQVVKEHYIPGDFAKYAQRFLRLNDIKDEPTTKYKVNTITYQAIGIADTSKCYAVKYNTKTSASNVRISDEGILLGINSDIQQPQPPKNFIPATKPTPINPRQYMNEEILSAGSVAKMAELTAAEIYDIRESKNMLSRGQADYMPKDGEQLSIMLNQLNTQEKALLSLFTGTTTNDTSVHTIVICPEKNSTKSILFRLSQKLGLVDKDDLSGTPYYLTIEDLHTLPVPAASESKKKNEGLYVNVPGKISVAIYKGNEQISNFQTVAAQFGYTEILSGELFNKRFSTQLILNPATGSVEKIDATKPE